MPKNTRTLYDHPDGYVIGYADRHLIVTDDNGLKAHIPIGPKVLIELGLKMKAVSVTAEASTAIVRQIGGHYGV